MDSKLRNTDELDEERMVIRPKNGNKLAVGYLRVSTEMQVDEGHSLLNQKMKIKDYCRYKDLSIYCFYIDKGISGGKRDKRIALKLMIDELLPGTVVIINSISRLARDMKDLLNIKDEIQKKGCSIVSLSEQIDDSSPTGNLIFQIMGSFAELERKQIGERTSSVMNNLSSMGKLKKKPAYGWKVEGGERVHNVEEQEKIKKLLKLKEENPSITLAMMAREMNKDKSDPYKVGKIWYAHRVKTILEQNTSHES